MNSGGSRKFWWGDNKNFKHKTSQSSEIQRFFPPKIRWSPKKKKKKRSSPKLRLIFRPESEIQTFFLPKIRWSPKKKKKQKKKKKKDVFTEIPKSATDNEYDWIEHSLSKDVTFCFSCRCFCILGEYGYGTSNL